MARARATHVEVVDYEIDLDNPDYEGCADLNEAVTYDMEHLLSGAFDVDHFGPVVDSYVHVELLDG